MAQSPPVPDNLVRLLRKYGHETTSFQILEPGLAYWFDSSGEACVAYTDTGGAWVAVGGPIAPLSLQAAVAQRFAAAARAHGRRVRFFAAEQSDLGDAEFTYVHIGEQPFWDPARWSETLRGKRSLREQLRRARAKGVVVRRVEAAEFTDPDHPTRRAVDTLIAEWKESREMAPMGFVVQLDLDSLAAERRIFVAERFGNVIGILSAVPIYARNGWFFEDVLRRPEAPNGTIEMLFDYAMRAVAFEGSRHVTYGLAPLAHTPSRLLRWIRDHTNWLYHFDGLRLFKAKLMPGSWQPVYLTYPRRERGVRAVIDVLTAFAHGSFLRFGLATLRHRAADVTGVLALLLVPWTTIMALVDTERWFPSLAVKLAWIGYDAVLFVLLMTLVAAWRRSLAIALSAAAMADFALGCIQAGLYNIPAARGLADWVVMFLALGAPLFAAVFLWFCRDHDRLYPPRPE